MIRVSDPISLAKNQYTKFSMIENSFTRKLSQRRSISLNALLIELLLNPLEGTNIIK